VHQKEREESKTPWAIIRLRGEDETDAISDDASKVVNANIEIMFGQGLPMDILEQFQAELIARADRTFLWVPLILELLELKVASGASRLELYELLRNRDIYKTYDELLFANENQAGARKLLKKYWAPPALSPSRR
jgi:protein SERAC1